MKQVDFQIMEQSYVLGCPEGGEHQLEQAVAKVDSAMCKIRDSGKLRSRERIAVLAALNLAFEQIEAAESETKRAQEQASTQDETRLKDLLTRMEKALGYLDKK